MPSNIFSTAPIFADRSFPSIVSQTLFFPSFAPTTLTTKTTTSTLTFTTIRFLHRAAFAKESVTKMRLLIHSSTYVFCTFGLTMFKWLYEVWSLLLIPDTPQSLITQDSGFIRFPLFCSFLFSRKFLKDLHHDDDNASHYSLQSGKKNTRLQEVDRFPQWGNLANGFG